MRRWDEKRVATAAARAERIHRKEQPQFKVDFVSHEHWNIDRLKQNTISTQNVQLGQADACANPVSILPSPH